MVKGPKWHAPEFAGQVGRAATTDFKIVDESILYEGGFYTLYNSVIQGSDGASHDRAVIRHPGAVAVVALADDGDVHLVEQYRTPLDANIIEIPAGKLDIDAEEPKDAAARELAEEIGYEAGSIELLLNMHHTPGLCDEYCHIFLATDLQPCQAAPEGPEEVAMTTFKTPLDEAIEMCFEGKISDSKTVAGLLAAARKLS